MTKKDRTRLYAIRLLIDSKMTVRDTAEALGLSERQVKRLKAGVKQYGDAFIVHKDRGRKPVHAILDTTRELIIDLAKTTYKGANYTHFSELLEEREGVVISRPTVARILTAASIESPRKHRRKKSHRTRERKTNAGLLVQMDASPFMWATNQKWSLHGAIDDATGSITGLTFCKEECLAGYFTITKQMVSTCGIPVSIYADRHNIFQSPKKSKLSIEEELLGQNNFYTQFGRACQELGITLIPAYTPQAKGRVERLWETLQDRLSLEMRLADITGIDAANMFLPTFITRFNARFAVAPAHKETAFRKPTHNINNVLVRKERRKLDNGSAFVYMGVRYQMVRKDSVIVGMPRSTVLVLVGSGQGLRAEYRGHIYHIRVCPKPKKIAEPTEPKQAHTPPANHPWRRGLPVGVSFNRNGTAVAALYSSSRSHL